MFRMPPPSASAYPLTPRNRLHPPASAYPSPPPPPAPAPHSPSHRIHAESRDDARWVDANSGFRRGWAPDQPRASAVA